MLEVNQFQFATRGSTVVTVHGFNLSGPEMVCVQGPNGCGKSSLLELLAGFHPALRDCDAAIRVNGLRIAGYSQNKLPVVLLWQDLRLFEHLSPTQNVLFATSGGKKSLGTLQEHLNKLQNRRNSRGLSKGQAQLVALLRALVRVQQWLETTKPLLLLDEPFEGMDETVKRDAKAYLQEFVVNSGIICLVVDHDQDQPSAADGRLSYTRHFVFRPVPGTDSHWVAEMSNAKGNV